MKKSKYGWRILIIGIDWRKGKAWKWAILPCIEYSQWQKDITLSIMYDEYYSAWIDIRFLKLKFSIGIRRLRKIY